MTTEIDELVERYLAAHPDHKFPKNGMRHPAVLAIVGDIKDWLIDEYGGLLPYWTAMLKSARIWFQPGDDSPEFRIFRVLFEAEGNSFWSGDRDFEALAREYNAWRDSMLNG